MSEVQKDLSSDFNVTRSAIESQVHQFRSAIATCDASAPFVIFTHGNCSDGAYAGYIAERGLVALGFSVSCVVPYYHNTNNLAPYVDRTKGSHILFTDVTPTPDEYAELKMIASTISCIDHHPPKTTMAMEGINILSVTDRTECATTLVCSIFNPALLTNPLIRHINLFDNGFLDDPVSKAVAMYNRHHINSLELFSTVFSKISFDDIVHQGRLLEEKNELKIKETISKGQHYMFAIEELKKDVTIFEVKVDDEFLPSALADAFYKESDNKNKIVVTIFYPITGGTKFSFRSIENANGVYAVTLAGLIGGGGHKHSSACFHKDKISSYYDKLNGCASLDKPSK